MQKLSLHIAKNELENKLNNLLTTLKELTNSKANSSSDKIALLRAIRFAIYENLNQYQHENLIINAAVKLREEFKEISEWKWHPNQTGDKTEVDLQGYQDGKLVLCAEITTSLQPKGTFDSRMRETLKN